ncbi:DUF5666 domain-containing protein [Methylobacterium planeticum]|uniref:DUF5666 domain-containing protein n=1 Tax=Methylobacterium planeticum TaxID=2615211 RepID=A0A6N6MYX7_9HYPH|nr:DUF5666 domain-containing protein [Methylobacterium planeticum]KAB1075533.1 hypothetical protein F6X51_02285 [Methylobacterium planeticum]
MRPPAPSRRDLLRLLAGLGGALLPRTGRAAPDAPIRDQGIGGTGARPEGGSRPEGGNEGPLGEGDRGIGGTGVIGTIRRFGSIIVNDLRIAYPADVAVRIDGAPARAGDLRIGQVVRVVAREAGRGLATGRIEVTSEVVGPVEAVTRGGLTVLGQRISTAGLKGRWSAGDRVAVSGLRRPDGVVVASLIESRATGPAQVAGPVRRGPDGAAMIGGLRLEGMEAALVGSRALVTGEPAAGGLRVANATEAGALFVPGLRRVSIEAYIGRNGDRLALGSGIGVAGGASADVPRRGSVRAVLTTDVARDGRLTVEQLRIDDRRPPGGFERGPERAPDGPGRFDRAPDRLDLRHGLPGTGPNGPGGGPSPRGLEIDTRPSPGDRPGGFGGGGGPGPGGGPGGGGPGAGPGGFGGPGPGGPGGFGAPGGGLGAPGGGLGTPGGGPGGFGGRR